MTSTFTPRFHWDNCAGTDDDLSHWDGREGDAMVTCETCGRISVHAPSLVVEEPPAVPEGHRCRYWLACARCGHDMWLDSQRPRIPLCDRCRRAPEQRKETSDELIA
jgi:hypothetical protein